MNNHTTQSLEERVVDIGLIAAGGTGQEVTGILQHVINEIGELAGVRPQFQTFNYNPKTFWELKDRPGEKARIEEAEVTDLVGFCRESYQEGVRVIFQSATNAGTLYRQRMETEMLKLMEIPTPDGAILVAREQSQGPYALEEKVERADRIAFTSSYEREKLYRTLDAAIAEARARFGDEPFSVRFVYKYHLFDAFNGWIDEYIAERGLEGMDIAVVQPDTGYDYLMRRHLREGEVSEERHYTLVVASNEIGDLLTEALPNHYGVGDKATMFAKNVSLEPQTEGQEVYQTIHGSADDIAGTGKLNPFATIRAAADILERHAGVEGAIASFEAALREAEAAGVVTPDRGGSATTTEVVDYVLEQVKKTYAQRV